jgi:hypothetical protein
MPEERDAPAHDEAFDHLVEGLLGPRHLEPHVEALDHVEAGHDLAQVLGRDVDGWTSATWAAGRAAGVHVGDDDGAGARMAATAAP